MKSQSSFPLWIAIIDTQAYGGTVTKDTLPVLVAETLTALGLHGMNVDTADIFLSGHGKAGIHPFICSSVRPSIHPSIHPPTHICVCLSVVRSIDPSMHLSIHLSFCLSVCLSVYQSVRLSIYQSIDRSIHPSIFLSVCLSVGVPVRPSVYLSVDRSIHPCIHPSIVDVKSDFRINLRLHLARLVYQRSPVRFGRQHFAVSARRRFKTHAVYSLVQLTYSVSISNFTFIEMLPERND